MTNAALLEYTEKHMSLDWVSVFNGGWSPSDAVTDMPSVVVYPGELFDRKLCVCSELKFCWYVSLSIPITCGFPENTEATLVYINPVNESQIDSWLLVVYLFKGRFLTQCLGSLRSVLVERLYIVCYCSVVSFISVYAWLYAFVRGAGWEVCTDFQLPSDNNAVSHNWFRCAAGYILYVIHCFHCILFVCLFLMIAPECVVGSRQADGMLLF